MAESDIFPSHTVQDFKRHSSLWYRLHVFTYDLRKFSDKVDSQARLESIVDASYLGLPYLQNDEVDYIISTLIDGTTLQQRIQAVLEERLERRMKKRVESRDYRVYAAHDLAPILEEAFGIKRKELATDWRFQGLLTRYGLRLGEGEGFEGLMKVSTFGQRKRKGKPGRRK